MARTAKQKAAQRKASLASARKRRRSGTRPAPTRRNARINRKISRTRTRTKKRINKQAGIVQRNMYTHSTQGGVYLTGRGVKAYNKGVKIDARSRKKIAKYKARTR